MRGSRRRLLPLIVVLLTTSSLGAPLAGAQVLERDYCPAGDQEHGPPDPPGADADKPHIDLIPGEVELRFPQTGTVVEKRGQHIVARSGGSAELDIQVRNIGDADAPESQVRLTLERPGGSTKNHLVDVPPVPSGTTGTVTASVTLGSGLNRLTVHVNPEKDPAESCTDSRPNNDCGTMTQGCDYTYYDNNRRTIGLFTGELPALRVEEVLSDPPKRATHGPSPDSRAELRLRIQNTGGTDAFHLGGDLDDPPPFIARITVPDCPCAPQELNVTRIPAGGSRTITTELPVHGLRDEYTVQVELDPYAETADLDRSRATGEHTFPLPTPNLVAETSSEHPKEGERLLVPEGEDLVFDVVVKNIGDADARTTDGGGFRVVVDRDRSGNTVAQTTMAVAPGESGTLRVTERAQDIDGSHTYRITVDHDDEVLETSKAGNLRFVPVAISRHEAQVKAKDDDMSPTVPPGADAAVVFTIANTGTVTDTYRLEVPADDQDAQHYEDMKGTRIEQVKVPAEKETRVQLVRKIPKDAHKGTTYESRIRAVSASTGDTYEQEVLFTVGDDTMPPQVRLERPKSGFLGDDKVVLEVTDNVQVEKVETDIYGSYQEVRPDQAGGSLYTINAAGTPDFFTLSVRAVDSAGNEVTKQISLSRDKERPEIARVRFTPSSGLRAGDKVSMIATVYDDNLDRVEVQITQPRPGGRMYMENITITEGGPNHILRDWRIPERPGHYVFNVTAYDQAGNQVTTKEILTVRGLNIEIASNQPRVVPQAPREGETVRLTYLVRNTSPDFETGSFLVTLVVDFRRQIGLQRINLAPGETRAVSFTWTAEIGPHAFTFVVDQAEEIAEDDEEEEDNLHFTETGILFRKGDSKEVQDLFKPETIELRYAATFGELVGRHWWVSVLLVALLGLFAAAFVLARRNGGV